ncbi:helix-turn-helix domain-containing protein [Amycolatopsis sp. A1MSW2902]
MKLADLDVICAVLGCEIGEILIPEPKKIRKPVTEETPNASAAGPS